MKDICRSTMPPGIRLFRLARFVFSRVDPLLTFFFINGTCKDVLADYYIFFYKLLQKDDWAANYFWVPGLRGIEELNFDILGDVKFTLLGRLMWLFYLVFMKPLFMALFVLEFIWFKSTPKWPFCESLF